MKKVLLKEKETLSSNERKKRILAICKGLLSLGIFLLSGYLQIIPIIIFNIDTNNYTNKDLALVNAFTDVLLVIILVAIYFKDLKEQFNKFKKNYKNDLDTGLKYWIVGLVIMCVTNILISIITPLASSSNETAVQSLIQVTPFLMLITAGIIAPITEELTFREGFRKIFTNKWLYCFASGFVFGFLHVFGSNNPLEYLYIVPYGSLGFFFALTRYETDNIYSSICMHAIHNTTLVLLSILTF